MVGDEQHPPLAGRAAMDGDADAERAGKAGVEQEGQPRRLPARNDAQRHFHRHCDRGGGNGAGNPARRAEAAETIVAAGARPGPRVATTGGGVCHSGRFSLVPYSSIR
jgi:hypothetical protein